MGHVTLFLHFSYSFILTIMWIKEALKSRAARSVGSPPACLLPRPSPANTRPWWDEVNEWSTTNTSPRSTFVFSFSAPSFVFLDARWNVRVPSISLCWTKPSLRQWSGHSRNVRTPRCSLCQPPPSWAAPSRSQKRAAKNITKEKHRDRRRHLRNASKGTTQRQFPIMQRHAPAI